MDTAFKEPRPVDIPHPQRREAARVCWERRDFSVVEVLGAPAKFTQPELLSTTEESPDIVKMNDDNSDTSMVWHPCPCSGRQTRRANQRVFALGATSPSFGRNSNWTRFFGEN